MNTRKRYVLALENTFPLRRASMFLLRKEHLPLYRLRPKQCMSVPLGGWTQIPKNRKAWLESSISNLSKATPDRGQKL